MINLKMENGDFVLDSQNNLALVSDEDEFLQSIQEILRTNAGEWFLNDEHGLRRYELLGSKYNQDDAINIISEAIFQHEETDSIEKLELDFDRKTRKMSVLLEITKKNGETIEGGVVF